MKIIIIIRITNMSRFILITMISWILFEEIPRKISVLTPLMLCKTFFGRCKPGENCIRSELCSEMTFGNRCIYWGKHGKSLNILYNSIELHVHQSIFFSVYPKGPPGLLVLWWWVMLMETCFSFPRIMKCIRQNTFFSIKISVCHKER